MTSQILPIPSAPYFQSKLRLLEGSLRLYDLELIYLANQLESGLLEQLYYDDCVVAIERDKAHVRSEIITLTEIKASYLKSEAA